MTAVADLLLTAWRGFVIFFWHAVLVIPSAVLVALHPRGGEIGHGLFARFWGRITLAMCGVRLRTEGTERLDPDGTYVFVSNHASEFDFYAISASLDFQWRALMRPGLAKIPVYGFIARRTGHVFLPLGDPERIRPELERALGELAAGHSLLVFAEGARAYDGALRPLKPGAFVLAKRAGVPVVPITVDERLRAPRRRVLGRALAHRVEALRLVVHDPIPPDAGDVDALAAATTEAMRAGLTAGAEGERR